MDVAADALSFGGWLVAAAILFRAWRRFHGRGSKLAVAGILLILISVVLRLALPPIVIDLMTPHMSRASTAGVIAMLGLPSFVGIILLVYAYWMMVARPPFGDQYQIGDDA